MFKKRPFIIACAVIMTGIGSANAEDPDEYEVWEPAAGEYTDTVSPAEGADAKTDEKQSDKDSITTWSTILGEPNVDAETLCRFVRRRNPDFNMDIAECFIKIGKIYGIRGDIALCQAIVETGWFRFADGTAVKPDQHNYCGLGVTKRGMTGSSFESIADGVTAHIQHLYAYATTAPLPSGEKLLDPRFSMVKRGVARTWHDLSNRWAMNPNYGRQIYDLYSQLLGSKDNDKETK